MPHAHAFAAQPLAVSLAEVMATAIRDERAGRAREAEVIYRGILATDARVAEAWLRLGGLALSDGRHRMAARCFARVMLLAPDRAQALHNLGEALRLAGRKAQAAIAFRRALRLRPDYPKALLALGLLRNDGSGNGRGRHVVARSLVLDPAFSRGWEQLGALYRERNQPEVTARLTRRAALCEPDRAAAQAVHGLALGDCKRIEASVAGLRRAAALASDDPSVLGNLAYGLMQAGETDAALRTTARLRRLAPLAPEADAQDALILMMEGEFIRAAALARRAVALAPAHAASLINHALVLHSMRASDASVRWNRRALRLDGTSVVARFNLSMTLLQRGDFTAGWPLYEARWAMGGNGYPRHAPAWDGSPLNGRSILLVAEQGHGDTLHFARYASLLAEQGGRVTLLVQPALKRLLAKTPGVTACHGLDETPPDCDVCAPMLSVPGLVGTRLSSVPAAIPYLMPDERDREGWMARLAGERRLKVGLVWAGEPRRGDFKARSVDRRRSLTLDAFAPLAAVPNVAFYSLQIGEAAAQAKAPPPGMALTDWTGAIRDFADTAAFVAALDLVVTVDTSVCHLAGGLGRPVWVLSRFDACWRWLGNREDSPWYPTMSLFHQDEPGAWDAPIARVAEALAELAAGFAEPDAAAGEIDATPALAPALNAALAAHRAGRLMDAATGYRRALAVDPALADALHLLGLVELSTGRAEPADALLHRALRLDGGRASFWNSLGERQRTGNRPTKADTAFRRAVAINPGYAEPLINLAKLAGHGGPAGRERRLTDWALRLSPGLPDGWRVSGDAAAAAGDTAAAAAAYRRALALAPADAEALDQLAVLLERRGLAVEGERLLSRAVALRPEFAETFGHLGRLLRGRRHFAEALAAFQSALALHPTQPDPWNDAASVLHDMGDAEGATAHYRRAVALAPTQPIAYSNLAEVLRANAVAMPDFDRSETLARRALTLVPGHPAALNVLSVLCLDLRRLDEAEAGFRRILADDPASAQARFNLSLVLLKGGHLREGWEHYEERWRVGEVPVPQAPGTLWTGEPLEGRTILLHAEQGNGDVLQFARYAPLVAARGGRVRLAVHSGLRRLMERLPGLLSVHNLHDPLPVTDLHCPLLSLPRAFGTTLDDIPAEVPYLSAVPEEVARWRARLPADRRLKVGLVWSGDPRPHNPKANATDRRRSLTLADLAPLARARDVVFVSLQKGAAAAQTRTPPAGMELIDLMDEVTDFADTAALASHLDLVITVDTSVAHLAGGLGRPVWVLSRYSGCWRWLMDRDDSPWYPTLRLFHQDAPGDWSGAITRLADALSHYRA